MKIDFGGLYHPQKDMKFLWCLEVIDNKLSINESLYKDLPSVIRKSSGRRLISLMNSDRCFYSGVRCYVVPEYKNKVFTVRPTWRISLDHLLPTKLKIDTSKLKRANHVQTSSYVNKKLGHSPASLKLLERRYLKTKDDYCKDDYHNNFGTIETIIKHLIEFENQFKFYGKYPWQPWAYTIPKHRTAAYDFYNKLIKSDIEFFRGLTLRNRMEYFDNAILPFEELI